MAAGGECRGLRIGGRSRAKHTVFPFILRAVNLLGINSVKVPNARRREIWARIMRDLPMSVLDKMITVAPFDKVVALGEQILAGKTRGRIVINVRA